MSGTKRPSRYRRHGKVPDAVVTFSYVVRFSDSGRLRDIGRRPIAGPRRGDHGHGPSLSQTADRDSESEHGYLAVTQAGHKWPGRAHHDDSLVRRPRSCWAKSSR